MRNLPTWAVLFAATALSGGCTALNNPVPDAIPVRRLPDEVLRAAPGCGPGCDPVAVAVARANKPAPQAAGAQKDITRAAFESADALPPGPLSDSVIPPAVEVPAPACGTCAPSAVFYTGGGLPPGEHPLRRDLRVTEAVALVHGPIKAGFGRTSPKRVTILRRLPTGQQVSILVEMNEALRDPRENVPIWPNDMILSHETGCQTTGRIFGSILLAGARVPARVLTWGALP